MACSETKSQTRTRRSYRVTHLRDGIGMIIGIKRVLASRDKITDQRHCNNIIQLLYKNRFIFLICIISTLCARVETERNRNGIIL